MHKRTGDDSGAQEHWNSKPLGAHPGSLALPPPWHPQLLWHKRTGWWCISVWPAARSWNTRVLSPPGTLFLPSTSEHSYFGVSDAASCLGAAEPVSAPQDALPVPLSQSFPCPMLDRVQVRSLQSTGLPLAFFSKLTGALLCPAGCTPLSEPPSPSWGEKGIPGPGPSKCYMVLKL